MQNFDDNIDLDALFDMLNIGESEVKSKSVETVKTATSKLSSESIESQDISSLDADFFLFDLPTDQS